MATDIERLAEGLVRLPVSLYPKRGETQGDWAARVAVALAATPAVAALLAEAELDEADAQSLASLVDAAMQSDCAFDDDLNPRTCFVHNAEWPSLERPCEWVIEGNAILTRMGERARQS